MGKQLSPEQVFAEIIAYKERNDGHSPTHQELGDLLGVSSACIYGHISKLYAVGKLFDTEGNRGYKVLGGNWTYEPEEDS